MGAILRHSTEYLTANFLEVPDQAENWRGSQPRPGGSEACLLGNVPLPMWDIGTNFSSTQFGFLLMEQ